MNRKLKRLLGASCLLLCAGFGMQAGASIVGVDFGPPASSTPSNWNLVTGPGVFTGLVNETGDPTPIAITLTGPGIDNFNVSLLAATIPTHSTGLANLSGSVFTFEDRVDLSFTGLQPDARYDIWVFGARDILGDPGPAFEQAVSISGGASFVQVGADRELVVNGQVGAAAVDLANYAVTGQANASGELTIAVVDPGNLNILTGGVYLAGVALRPALEPNAVPSSTLWSLLLLGGLMTLVARRRGRSLR
ncbi:hypothetical protein Q6D67_12460 [Haliea sp. E1-2-M8]|uniref:hypothetical protein n=1 Tax=Haliea sp. E1-2-M8 TaxID=3064706 RepID=UPI0027250B91|nr:hypothetical protein [Haliea sp. E1-2-M8]MDO8862515.1 hypothetical protein [Haliea sp. E1-2-M8]